MKLALILAAAVLMAPLMITNEVCCGEIMAENTGNEKETDNLNAILNQLSWLAGRWEGEAFGGRCEEIWSPPSAGSMVGLFKVWKNDEISFYEIETIAVDSSGLALNVKHFNADLTGWEEKDEVARFPLVSAGPEEINFEGLTYRKISPDSIQISLDIKDKEGNIREIKLELVKSGM